MVLYSRFDLAGVIPFVVLAAVAASHSALSLRVSRLTSGARLPALCLIDLNVTHCWDLRGFLSHLEKLDFVELEGDRARL
jgi:hypothetical protein